jgi:hypothetical protein
MQELITAVITIVVELNSSTMVGVRSTMESITYTKLCEYTLLHINALYSTKMNVIIVMKEKKAKKMMISHNDDDNNNNNLTCSLVDGELRIIN